MVRPVPKVADAQPDARPVTLRIAALVADIKALQIRAFDVRGLTVLADSFVLCSAASEPQLRAIYNNVREGMKAFGVLPLHSEGTPASNWVVMDYGNVILHIFREEARAYYDLDGLWGDAPQIDLELDS